MPADKPLKISEDTSTLLNKDHLEEFMKPYTERLFAHFGGGYIHYCGDNKHLLALAPTFKQSLALNFGNPERHDPKSVLEDLGKVGQQDWVSVRMAGTMRLSTPAAGERIRQD